MKSPIWRIMKLYCFIAPASPAIRTVVADGMTLAGCAMQTEKVVAGSAVYRLTSVWEYFI